MKISANFFPYRQPICRQNGCDGQVLRFKLGEAPIYIFPKLSNKTIQSRVRILKAQLGINANTQRKSRLFGRNL